MSQEPEWNITMVTPNERAQKSLTMVLKRLEHAGSQKALAESMGVSESQISGIKTEHLEKVLRFLAHLDLKIVSSDAKCLDIGAYEFLTRAHERVLRKAPQLIWDDTEL